MTHFTNISGGKKSVAFAAPYPGKIIPIDLAEIGGELLCQKDAFLCAAYGTKVGIAFTKRFGAGFFGGEGFILQRLQGDGMTFIHVGGTVVKKELNNEIIKVDTGCIAAFTSGIDGLCRECPLCKNDRCASPRGDEEEVRKWDAIILKRLGLKIGEILSVGDIQTIIKQKAPLDLCFRCQWRKDCRMGRKTEGS